MNRIFSISSTSALFFLKGAQSSLPTFSPSLQSPLSILCKATIHTTAIVKPITSQFTSPGFRVQSFSTTRRGRPKKLDSMDEEKNAFYVVRKGDIIGVYKSFTDCQAQVGSSVCDPSVSVFKGYSLPKEAEEHLTSRGLKNALYSVRAGDVTDDLFGDLLPCPFQQPDAKGKASKKPSATLKTHEVLETVNNQSSANVKASNKPSQPKRSQDVLEPADNMDSFGSSSFWTDMLRKQAKLGDSVEAPVIGNSVEAPVTNRKCISCTLAFDGASKGNPGQAGAGAVLRADDGSVVYRLREGVGIATNNVAEYRAFILGLKQALSKGFKRIRVQGDSKLVCMQVQGLWKIKNENMGILCKEAKDLTKKFLSFEINHVLRDFNSEADAQANYALNLLDGQVEETVQYTLEVD